MKKSLLAVCTAVMALSVFCVPASAVTAVYPTTQAFMNKLDQESVNYRWLGVDNNNLEKMEISFTGDYKDSIDTTWYFEQDPNRVGVRIFYYLEYSPADYSNVLDALNTVNMTYLYCNFMADTSDNTVTIKYDMPVDAATAGESCYDMLYRLIGIADDAYQTLSRYDISNGGGVSYQTEQPAPSVNDTGIGTGNADVDNSEEEKQPKF